MADQDQRYTRPRAEARRASRGARALEGWQADRATKSRLKARCASKAGLITAVYRAQADALEIEAQAKRRLADEYDAAQERGEIRTRADNQHVLDENKPRVHEIGLSRKEIHEARIICA